ncbi:MAG: c-type cytochrome [Acidobacteria bacterium]|nr:c-type cytochrome [Acidobacteriota bacterium]
MRFTHVIAAALVGVAAVAWHDAGADVRVGADLKVGPYTVYAAYAQDPARRSVKSGVYTPEQAKRGRDHYRTRCVLCHLDNGQGQHATPAIPGESLEREGDAEAPPVAGDEFLKKWSGQTVRALYDRLAATMPVGAAGSMSPQEYADLLAHLFELSKLPAGRQELPAARDQLDLITIER